MPCLLYMFVHLLTVRHSIACICILHFSINKTSSFYFFPLFLTCVFLLVRSTCNITHLCLLQAHFNGHTRQAAEQTFTNSNRELIAQRLVKGKLTSFLSPTLHQHIFLLNLGMSLSGKQSPFAKVSLNLRFIVVRSVQM